MNKQKNEIKTLPNLSLKTIAGFLTAGMLLFATVSCDNQGNQREEEESADYEEGLGFEDLNDTQEVAYIELEERFKEWDKDGNLRWDRNEFIAAANSVGLYSAWNNNEDDALTVSELSEGVFNIYDENNDNLMDKEEFAAWNEAWGRRDYADRWDTWDTNNDNSLTAEEFTTGFDEAGAFDRWDVVDENVYTKEEVYNALFAALDTGGDGYLTEEEYRQINDYMRGI